MFPGNETELFLMTFAADRFSVICSIRADLTLQGLLSLAQCPIFFLLLEYS
jgi:hypothetical protein